MLGESIFNSAKPWKLHYRKTFTQNTDSSKLPKSYFIKLLKEENVNMAFTIIWCSKYIPHKLSFRNGALVHICKAMITAVPSSSEVKQKKRLTSFVDLSGLALG